jgi:hypothetical protein
MNEIVVKLAEEGADTGARPGVAIDASIRVVARSGGGGQKKVAEAWPEVPDGKTRSRWALTCDEGVGMGGEDSAPTPLLYFAAGVAF